MLNPQRSFVDPLLAWHEENGRDHLPWREPDRTAFEILVAEILLQRTSARAVAGAYIPFVARYPAPEAVVAATEDGIEDRIAPLGLLKRAGFIARCSQEIVARHSGDVPRCYSELLNLHGVGEYTARSVLIHAFGAGVSAVDTNVRRLVSRFFDLPPDSRAITDLADALAPTERGSGFQYAMLDFAAAICTARSPQCASCPLNESCDNSDLSTRE